MTLPDRKMKRLHSFVMIISVLAVTAGTASCLPYMTVCAKTAQTRLNEAQSEYAETKDKKETAAGELGKLTANKNSLEGELEGLNTRMCEAADILEGLEDNIERTQGEIDVTWGKIEELSVTVEELQARADEEYQKAKDQIKFAYETGGSLRPVFMSGEMTYADYINRTLYMQMFAGYYQDTIDELIKTSEELSEKKSEYEENLVKLEVSKEALEDYQDTVEEQYGEINDEFESMKAKVAKYEDDIEETQKRIDEYERKMSEKQSDIEMLKAQIAEEQSISQKAQSQSWKDISSVAVSDSDRKLLANLIWCEAGNEPYTGQVAVGAVVMNRVMSSVFPDTVTGVIYQYRQFTPASSGKLALALSLDSADESCYRAADSALAGVSNVGNCLYFRSPTSSVSPKYTIGGHIFY